MQNRKTAKISRVRSKISGTAERPRLAVFRSNLHISAQLIDDETGITIARVSDADFKTTKDADKALEVGKLIAQKAKAKKITSAVFDRRYYKYHGKIKKVADGARGEGLNI